MWGPEVAMGPPAHCEMKRGAGVWGQGSAVAHDHRLVVTQRARHTTTDRRHHFSAHALDDNSELSADASALARGGGCSAVVVEKAREASLPRERRVCTLACVRASPEPDHTRARSRLFLLWASDTVCGGPAVVYSIQMGHLCTCVCVWPCSGIPLSPQERSVCALRKFAALAFTLRGTALSREGYARSERGGGGGGGTLDNRC